MKIKGLLLGMMACAALVACTNDDIVENNGNEQPEKVKANLTLTISASSNSSRASVGGGQTGETGDTTDGGITGESTVTDAVIILNRLNGSELSKDEFGGYMQKAALNETTVSGTTVYQPFFSLMQSGSYKVLVVLNPTEAVKAIANDQTENAKSKYERITDDIYTYSGTGDMEIATSGHFMMVNYDDTPVSVESNNYDNPSRCNVSVERVVSKINYLPKKAENRYPITVTTTNYTIAETTSGWYIEPNNNAVHLTGLHKAKNKDANDAEVWIHEGVDGRDRRAFTQTNKTYGETEEYVFDLVTPFPKFEYYTKSTSGSLEWSVTLDKYALVNLSKSVYTVRHRANSLWSAFTTMGLLDTDYPYIMDPSSISKNSANYDNISTDYFYNLLADVNNDKVDYSTADQTYFQSLPTSVNNDNAAVGERLTYCLENVVTKSKQAPALVTGIIFRGQIGDKDGNSLGTVYKCNGKFYLSIDAVIADNGANASYETYYEGRCYYYSSDIMHNAGDDYMERAIMRNNIYVLSVESFKAIGSATIQIDPSGEEVNNEYYLQMTASILPWVVRFNNIEF
jgi:hypothetical protein